MRYRRDDKNEWNTHCLDMFIRILPVVRLIQSRRYTRSGETRISLLIRLSTQTSFSSQNPSVPNRSFLYRNIVSHLTIVLYHFTPFMFFTKRLMLRGIDPEVDNAIWLQWTNAVDSINAITTQGPLPWSRERSKQLLETRTKDKDALPWFIICERPTVENEPGTVLGPDDDYYRTADGHARYPAIGMLTMDKVGGATDVNRIVSFGILFDQGHQGKHFRCPRMGRSCPTVQVLKQ